MTHLRELWMQWPRWAVAVPFIVVTGYVLAAAAWFAGGPYAFARPSNPESNFDQHWLADLPAASVQMTTVVGGVGLLAALTLMVRRVGGRWRPVVLTVAGGSVVFLTLILPDAMSLDVIPVLNLLNLKRLSWVTVHLVLLAYTGVTLAAAIVAYARATRPACRHCGSVHGVSQSVDWERWGRITAIAAFVAPLGYAFSRVCWAFDVPLGTTEAYLDQLVANNPGHGTKVLELTLATMAMCGGVLTLGLTHRWGRIWPRWLIGLAGKPVPRWFPLGLATVCGIGLVGVGSPMATEPVRALLGETLYYGDSGVPITWAGYIPMVSLAVWGPLVLLAALAFHFRTRGETSVGGARTHSAPP